MKAKRRRKKAEVARAAAPRGAARTNLLAAATLALLTLLVFCPVLGHDFLDLDDHQAITENPAFQPPAFEKIARYWAWPRDTFYVPITYSIWGATAAVSQKPQSGAMPLEFYPAAFHALNWIAHVLATVTLWLVLKRLTGYTWASWVGAAVFAVHPLQVEPVAWASSMYTPLSGFFALVATWQYLAYSDAVSAENRGGRATWHVAAATIAFTAALLTKPAVVSVPLIVAAIDLLWRRRPWRTAWPLAVWLAGSVAITLITRLAQPPIGVTIPPIWGRLLVAMDAVAFYVYKLVAPVRLTVDYGRSPRWLMAHHEAWITAIVPVALLGVFWFGRRRAPWLAAAIAVFFLGTLPTLGLMPFDFQHYSTVADRYAYLSLVGVALAVAAILSASASRAKWVVAAAALVVLTALSVHQLWYWGDDARLFGHALAVNPGSLAANSALGFISARRGDEALAESYYRRALAIDSDDFRTLFNLGNLMARRGNWDEAIGLYRRAILVNPQDAALYHNLIFVLLKKGDLDGAAGACREAISVHPDLAEPHAILGELCARRGDFHTAYEQFIEAARLDPSNASARRGLAQLRQMGIGLGP